ncbi:YciI family protein [Micromonospora sp. WMMD1082]|uniref:YciI family protein n=1 Tax=Micromonospora sp. WMMD1082 TaxID=3016104 RepID=UPI0024164E38|nr:YciI family protein [Micromonospora sp. WMMD1082]MDG4792760.1 YciI family protein [Micromonospora sp. WMMD1082]
MSICPAAVRIRGDKSRRYRAGDTDQEVPDMPQYLLSIYHGEGPPPDPEVLAPIRKNLAVLNQEMKDAGAWVFARPLHPPSTATVLRSDGGEVLMTDGPYTEGKEHLGGITIIEAPDLDAALEWGSKLARVLGGLPIEVRPLAEAAEG